MNENNNSNTPWSTALENIAKFANLLKSYALKWYDMYFNPTPKDVEVDKIADDSDELTTVTVPNLAKIKKAFDDWQDTVEPRVENLEDREAEVRASLPYEICADTTETPGATLTLTSYSLFKIFSYNHSTGAVSVSGYDSADDRSDWITNHNSGSNTYSVPGYKILYAEKLSLGHERHLTNGLPANFAKGVLDLLTQDGNDKDSITEFIFTKNAAIASSSRSIVVSTPSSNYISTLVIARGGVTGALSAWASPATGLGSAKITIKGEAVKF